MIEASLRKFGAGRSILLDRKGKVIAGNKTLENAGALGFDEVLIVQSDGRRIIAVQRTDLDMDEGTAARELAIADNRSGELNLEWNAANLEELAGEIDLSQFFTTGELASLLAKKVGPLLTDEDSVPDVPADPITKLGDMYELGPHRLLCGDATNVQHVERLLGGHVPDMVFTDPPYGMSAVSTSGVLKKSYGQDILGDDGIEAALDAYKLCAGLEVPKMIFWGANYYAAGLPNATAWLVWDKDNGGSDQMDCELAWTNLPGVTRQFTKASEKTNRVHPTQKPVALAEWCFERYHAGDVLDLFGGSGSTLIACEKTGRTGYLMELDPKFCDVIVKRWEEATGKQACRATEPQSTASSIGTRHKSTASKSTAARGKNAPKKSAAKRGRG